MKCDIRRWRALGRDHRGVDRLDRDPHCLRRRARSALREVGLDDLAISDVIHGGSFFKWANRLMLSLGQPV